MKNKKVQFTVLMLMFATLTFGFQIFDKNKNVAKSSENIPKVEEATMFTGISGPTLLESGVTGTWTVSSNVIPGWAKWYYKEGSGFSGSYTYTGTFNHTLQWTFENTSSQITVYVLKAEVQNILGTVVGTYYYNVTIWPEDCPGQLICM
ncbi:MAG: hypothetical protein BalsKO_22780 [Balneolaceae bacterium]